MIHKNCNYKITKIFHTVILRLRSKLDTLGDFIEKERLHQQYLLSFQNVKMYWSGLYCFIVLLLCKKTFNGDMIWYYIFTLMKPNIFLSEFRLRSNCWEYKFIQVKLGLLCKFVCTVILNDQLFLDSNWGHKCDNENLSYVVKTWRWCVSFSPF